MHRISQHPQQLRTSCFDCWTAVNPSRSTLEDKLRAVYVDYDMQKSFISLRLLEKLEYFFAGCFGVVEGDLMSRVLDYGYCDILEFLAEFVSSLRLNPVPIPVEKVNRNSQLDFLQNGLDTPPGHFRPLKERVETRLAGHLLIGNHSDVGLPDLPLLLRQPQLGHEDIVHGHPRETTHTLAYHFGRPEVHVEGHPCRPPEVGIGLGSLGYLFLGPG